MKFIKNENGFSMVEILVALGIIGGATWVFFSSSTVFEKTKDVVETKSQALEVQTGLLENSKRVLFDSKDDNDKRTKGFCELVKPDPVSKPPVGPVYINLKGLSGVLALSRWKTYLPDWKTTSNPKECANSKYSYCFAFDSSEDLELRKFGNLNPVFSIEIVPVNMNPKKGDLFEEIPASDHKKDLDGKIVGFAFKSNLFIDSDNGRKRSQAESFEWVGMAGYCDYEKGTDKFRLSFSGMEAVSGNDVIFNRNGFDTNKLAPVDIRFRPIVAQAGIYKPNGQYVFTDKSKNIVTSCKENRFRCRKRSSGERTYDDLSVVADVTYRTSNYVASSASMKTKISYKIKKSGAVLSSNNYYYGVGVDCSLLGPDGKPNPECKKGPQQTNLTGSHLISVTSFDTGSDFKTENTCRQICSSGNNYNVTGGGPQNRYVGYLNFEFVGYGANQEELVSDKIGCTACYMKNCDQFGIGTFGPMADMPYQPLDSTIPECSIYEDSDVLYNDRAHLKNIYSSTDWNSTGKCVVASLDSSSGKFILETEDCNKELPVMCYGYGSFFLARDLKSGSSAFSVQKYKDAAERCFETSHEKADVARLDTYLGSKPGLPTKGGEYDFYNLAHQGQFLAPQSDEDFKSYNKWRLENGVSKAEKFWVALKKDGEKGVQARPPVFADEIRKNNHALYYDGNKNLIYKTFPSSIKHAKGESKYGALLYHNIKYKGLAYVKKDSSSKEYRYLCRKSGFPFSFFVSKGKDDELSEGEKKCEDGGGIFLPPLTSYEWVKAMTLVEEMSNLHPFPDPSNASSPDPVWVALEFSSNSEEAIDFENVGIARLKDKFGDETKYSPATSDTLVVINGAGEYLDPYARVVSAEQSVDNFTAPADSKLSLSVNGSDYDVIVNSGSTDQTIEFSDLVYSINSVLGSDGRAKFYEKDGKKYLEIYSRKLGKDGEIQIKGSKIKDTLGYPSNKEKAPELNELCIEKDGKFNMINYKGKCDGTKLMAEELLSIGVFKNIWTLYNFPSSKNFAVFR